MKSFSAILVNLKSHTLLIFRILKMRLLATNCHLQLRIGRCIHVATGRSYLVACASTTRCWASAALAACENNALAPFFTLDPPFFFVCDSSSSSFSLEVPSSSCFAFHFLLDLPLRGAGSFLPNSPLARRQNRGR